VDEDLLSGNADLQRVMGYYLGVQVACSDNGKLMNEGPGRLGSNVMKILFHYYTTALHGYV